MKVYDALARSLAKDHDVSTIFGLLGVGTMLIVDELVHRHGGQCIRVAREDSAIMGAVGYQHSTGRLGVAAIGAGPALTNTFTPLVEASRNFSPLLVIADDGSEARGNVQGIDQATVIAPTGAAYIAVQSPETAVDDLRRAIELARAESRPVVLNLPHSIALSDIAEPSPQNPAVGALTSAPPSGIAEAIALIEASSRPVVLAGWGAYLADARGALDDLSELLGAPVATTMKAKSFFADSPFSLGTFGGFSSPLTKEIIGDADLILAFGASLNVWTADQGALLNGKSIIQIDTRSGNMSSTFPATVEVVGDAREVAELLTERLESMSGLPREFRSEEMRERLAVYDRRAGAVAPERASGTVDVHEFIARLEEVKPRGANVVTDGGRYVVAPMSYLTVEDARHWLAPIGGFGAIGLSLGAAIGFAVGRPEAPTVLVIGDGAFMMSLQELHTAVRNSLDLIVLVMNDHAYSSEYHFYLGSKSKDPVLATSLATFEWPEFEGMAKSLGFDAVTLTSMDDFATVSEAIQNRSRPLLVDVRLDPKTLSLTHLPAPAGR
jgi:acetolactate synthase I/II/III large subunit